MEASSDFFDQPPQRVSGPPFNTATSLVNGTSANTVSWYTGGTTTGSARATQVAQIGPSQTVDYGIQANEQGIASQLQAIAAFAAFTVSPDQYQCRRAGFGHECERGAGAFRAA